jgi:hypothetical protein
MNIPDLINKYSPVIYLHPDEKYFPCSIDWMIKHSTLIDFNTNSKKSPVTQKDLYDIAQKYNFERRADGDVVLSFDKELYKGEQPLSSVPCYAFSRTMQDGKIQIQYIFLFTYNGEYSIANLENVGFHPGDMEHLTVECSSTGELLRVFYSAHGTKDGRWVDAKDVELLDSTIDALSGSESPSAPNRKIVAYNALNGHGLYPKNGIVFRFGGFANDYLEKGLLWKPNVNVIYLRDDNRFNIDTMGWTTYNSRIGGNSEKPNIEGITGLPDKAWFQYGDNPDSSFYNPPRIIPHKNFGLINNIRKIILFSVLYFSILLILKIVTGKVPDTKKTLFQNKFNIPPIKQNLITIAIVVLLYNLYIYIGGNLIRKYVKS